ncbi:MAG: MFS transporter [Isosphaeraceae bacterium]|nr:MFS transporter [Isosphaeraceae bacterium]
MSRTSTRGFQHNMQAPTPDPAVAPSSSHSRALPQIGGRYFALAILFSMNLLNYVDRYSFFAVGTQIQHDLGIKDRGFGLLSASFMIVYTLVSPLIGWLGDRYHRRALLSFGVGLWSVATVGTAFSNSFAEMFFWRALLGVGEASYGVIAPALLSDLFEPKHRGRVIGLYFLALPLGGALGYGIGGWVAYVWHWRVAFWVVGLPGLLAAFAGLLIRDPGRGASEGASQTGPQDRPRFVDYLALFRNRSFLYNTAGMAAVTFATGAYAAWGSTFYQRVRGLTSAEAGRWIGGLTAGAGLIGIVLGTGVADALLRYTRRAYLLMASAAVLIAVPFGAAGILEPHRTMSLELLFVAMVMMAAVLGPCNTVTANVVPANQRAAGYALSIFLIHLFGDITSPILIGSLSDFGGKPSVVHSSLGQLFETLGAKPVGDTNLTLGMLSVIPVLILGALFFLVGSRHLAEDQERARMHGGGEDLAVLPAH